MMVLRIMGYLMRMLRRLTRFGAPPVPFFMRDRVEYADWDIGRWTYGEPQIRRWDKNGHLSIGSFCSIARGSKIMLGGEHRTDWITTFPFAEVFPCNGVQKPIGATKGDVVIGHDVWIGEDALILSGVRIGNGAVVGARAVVTKDVPAYAIVAGNPAKFIRYRIPEQYIDQMLRISWWDWPDEKIKEHLSLLLSNDFDSLIELSTRYSVPHASGAIETVGMERSIHAANGR
jgi:acetyltransferase-like isoleucine patch superfamily enzyme